MSAIVLSVGGAYFTRAQQCYSDLKDGRSIRDFGHCAHTRHAQPGVNASLATDSVKANNRLDMFVVIKFASLLHKGVSSDPRVLPRGEILDMAVRQRSIFPSARSLPARRRTSCWCGSMASMSSRPLPIRS